MGKKNPGVDAYIAKSADFAKPILNHVRGLVHTACPEVEETLKWGFPNFLHQGIMCSMAAFKAHCSFGFWKAALVLGKDAVADKESMGSFGRIASIADLPNEDVLIGYIQKAAALNESGVKLPAKPRSREKKELVVPPYFTAELKKNKKALDAFEASSYSHKKEYIEWITEAKGEETRQRRMATALQWLAEGKSRNWKYANC